MWVLSIIDNKQVVVTDDCMPKKLPVYDPWTFHGLKEHLRWDGYLGCYYIDHKGILSELLNLAKPTEMLEGVCLT